MLRIVISSVVALGIAASPSAAQATTQAAPADSSVSAPQSTVNDSTVAVRQAGAPRPVPVLSLSRSKANAPDAPQPTPPHVNDHGAKLMIFGGVAILVGAVVGGDAGWIISVGGACIGLYGLWVYLN